MTWSKERLPGMRAQVSPQEIAILQGHCREWKDHQHYIGIRFFSFTEDAGRFMPQTPLYKVALKIIG